MKKKLNLNKLQNKEIIVYFEMVSQLGLTVIGSMLFMFLIFLFLDRKFAFGGKLIPFGVILGVFLGIFMAYRILKKKT
ncbi:MAG: hypothetical protein HN952_07975 [Candidatus Cloacimonetes bacterium]|jgi:hypothetical protein|nr:hypothetical protein [Candidatus Cloacimonadota bacterium]MBT6994870.1 hypothetical protein [Candidatus Cloacimonadota bacterium]MBT7468805.1 hypothetical protein [Candidatus Cloacimonadota bacterium]